MEGSFGNWAVKLESLLQLLSAGSVRRTRTTQWSLRPASLETHRKKWTNWAHPYGCRSGLVTLSLCCVLGVYRDKSNFWQGAVYNKPFVRSGHMVRNKLCRGANNAVGLPKRRNSYQPSPAFLCFGSPTALFASQHNLFCVMWPHRAKGLLYSLNEVYLVVQDK